VGGPKNLRTIIRIINTFNAGVAQWQSRTLPTLLREFDSLHPLQILALEAFTAMHGFCKPESGVQVFTGAPIHIAGSEANNPVS
jgi:hypothetical protein